jgi:hypothetical protein
MELLLSNFITNKMMVNLNILSMSIKNKIDRYISDTLIITP